MRKFLLVTLLCPVAAWTANAVKPGLDLESRHSQISSFNDLPGIPAVRMRS